MNKKLFIPMAVVVTLLSGCEKEYDVQTPPEAQETSINWNQVNIDTGNDADWSLSYSSSWVALTNTDAKSQVYLTWEGGMISGPKTEATLKISQNGKLPQTYAIESLDLSSDGVNCTLTFLDSGGNIGIIKFPY